MQFENENEKSAYWALNNWTSKISDKVNVTQLSIPATHDSHATGDNVLVPELPPGITRQVIRDAYIAYSATQNLEISQQLRAGVRYLDLRVGGDLKMRHGISDLKGELSKVLDLVHQYLTDARHPRETVILCIMRDQGPNTPDGSETLYQFVKRTWNQYDWYAKPEWPTLGEVRGKAILFRRFSTDNNCEYGINGDDFYTRQDNLADDKPGKWSQQEKQNGSESLSPQDRWSRVEAHLKTVRDKGDDQVMYYTHLPGNNPPKVFTDASSQRTGELWKDVVQYLKILQGADIGELIVKIGRVMTGPKYFATFLTNALSSHLSRSATDLTKPTQQRFGVIMMDFVNAQVCVQIIAKNFQQDIHDAVAQDWNAPTRIFAQQSAKDLHIEYQDDGHLVVYEGDNPIWAMKEMLGPGSNKIHWSGNEVAMFHDGQKYFNPSGPVDGARLRFIGGPPYMMLDVPGWDAAAGGDWVIPANILYCSISGFNLRSDDYGKGVQ